MNKGRHNLRLFLLGSVLFVGILGLIIPNYGVSWDEFLIYEYADLNLSAYKRLFYAEPVDQLFPFYDLHNYGPAYLIIGNVFRMLISEIIPALNRYTFWHSFNFITFIMGAGLIFVFCRRIVTSQAAFIAAMLYCSQPLLWGHGIMNPKDSPFMVFFLGAVTTGMIMVDRIVEGGSLTWPKIFTSQYSLVRKWIKGKYRLLFFFSIGIYLLVLFDRISGNRLSRPSVEWLLTHASEANPGTIINLIFRSLASRSNEIPLDAYIHKMLGQVNFLEIVIIIIPLFVLLVVLLMKLEKAYRWLFLAGLVAGLAASVRILGPAAIGLVFIYALTIRIQRPLVVLGIYSLIAMIVMFIFWPYLWNDPVTRIWESAYLMSSFPWHGLVRFEGMDLTTGELPWYYLPKLISIQLTIPLLLLALVGILMAIIRMLRLKPGWQINLTAGLWFFVPIIAVVILNPNMYDNFRQFHFILPPLFLFAAISIEKMFSVVRRKWFLVFGTGIILVPGIVSGVWLSPYEYVYFNGLVGWTANVERRYETDYWGLSLCEAGKYMDGIASDGTRIIFTNPSLVKIFGNCSEKKFEIVIVDEDQILNSGEYFVSLTRYDDDLKYYINKPVIKTINRGKAIFSVIKWVQNETEKY